MTRRDRVFEMSLDIAADPASVWKALTEAEELIRWFPLQADVKPGSGGRIQLSWGELLTGDCNIKIWEPEQRLQMSWFEPVDGKADPGRELTVDFLIEGKGGQTTLRLIHSGFGSDDRWDDEYDSISRGWSYELRSLQLYLERHMGRARQVILERLPITGDVDAAWSRVIGENGQFKIAQLDTLLEGASFSLNLPDGTSTNASLLYQLSGKDFAAVLDVLGGGVLRLGLETFTGQPELWFWLASWALGRSELGQLMSVWKNNVSASVSARNVA